PLAVVEHRRVVLLTLADDHDAAHLDRVDQLAHRVDGRPVAALLVAATHPAPGRHRGRLGDPDQLERQVTVQYLGMPDALGLFRHYGPFLTISRPSGGRAPTRDPDRTCPNLLVACPRAGTGRSCRPRSPGATPIGNHGDVARGSAKTPLYTDDGSP